MTAIANAALPSISASLEDYLETIYLLVQERGFARVKDISKAREVKAASVSIALRRLSELGLVRYERREYIALTPDGEQAARRVFARHQLLTRFFQQVLRMTPAAAAAQACAMEHSLTDEAMSRLVGFFEFLGACPKLPKNLLESYAQCPLRSAAGATPGGAPDSNCASCPQSLDKEAAPPMTLCDLRPGQQARVLHIQAEGPLRQRLLDMGLLPDVPVDLERLGPGGDPVWIRCQGAQLALRRSEARSIQVRKGEPA